MDFSFPEWMTRQNTFADSLLKGAQVGSMIANARYRNQALAVQATQQEREFDLREKELASHTRTADLNYRLKTQMLNEQTDDKTAITSWIETRNKLPLDQRLSMDLPKLTLPQSYEIANKIMDNDRMAYASTEKAKAAASLQIRLRQLPADYQYRFDASQDPDERLQILTEGETEMQRRAVELKTVAPTIAADSREHVAEINAAIKEKLFGLKSAATVAKTQGVSESQFVNRHLNTIIEQLSFDAAHAKDSIENKTKLATDLLQNTYRSSGMAQEVAPAGKAAPAIGEVRSGYKFLGGNPADPNSWQKAQ